MNDIGSTHSAAIAILQSKKNSPIATNAVDMHAPTSSGIKCDDAVSICAQSAIIVLVRSDKSFFPKNESGIFLNFSASVIRLTPLSTYVDKNVALYWIYVDTAINTSVIITPAI